MSGLTLVASFPKSGNTWMRAFLASLAAGGRTPDLNAGMDTENLSWRGYCDRVLGISTADLTPAEVQAVRPYVSRQAVSAGLSLAKVHDANLAPPGAAEPPYPPDCIARVVYIVRDPRDVAASSVFHYGKPIAEIVADMNDAGFGVGYSKRGLSANVPQFISSWSRHVESWLDAPGLELHLVRYEDMQASPEPTFAGVAAFLGLTPTPADLRAAIAATRFERLAEAEARGGFQERSGKSDAPFFRRGQAGGWRTELPEVLAGRIVRDHAAVMRRLGYPT